MSQQHIYLSSFILSFIMLLEEEILENLGGLMNNNLIDKIAQLDIDDDELEKLNLTSSSYYTCDTLIETLQAKKGIFTVLSVNCQSIRAKYDKILLLIEQLKQYDLYFSIICLQESWLTEEADLTMFHISDYTISAKGKYISQHGGLLTYVHNSYIYEDIIIPIQSNIWEGQFLKLHSNDN